MRGDRVTEFEKGFCCAVATLIRGHGDSTEVSDLLDTLGLCSFVGVEPYDMDAIRTSCWWARWEREKGKRG